MLADLGHLAAAGVEIADALTIMASAADSGRTRLLITDLLNTIRRGQSLSKALSEADRIFPAHVIAIVRASEMAGSLAGGLQRVAADLRSGIALRKQVQTALVYPACIAAAAIGAISVLLLVVVPTLKSLFGDVPHRLPWQTLLLITTSDFVRSHAFLILFSLLASVAGTLFALRNDVVRARLEAISVHIPGIGTLISAAETARISRLFAVLAAARIPLATAIELVSDGAHLTISRNALASSAARLREGASLSQALSGIPTLSPRLLSLIGIGEMTGRLAALLEEAARGAEETVTTAIERLLALLTPALTVLFGAVAGFVLYAVMTAILSVNDLATMGR
jgi:type II secretory pathway component PulF